MLTNDDVQWIRDNRDEITQNRTVEVLTWGTSVTGTNPVTGEEITTTTPKTTYTVIWEIPNGKNDDVETIDGYEVEIGDRMVVFFYGVNIEEIDYVEYQGDTYRLLTKHGKGIGMENRFECLARKVT